MADDWSAGGIGKAAVSPDQRVFWFFGLADLGGQSEDATKRTLGLNFKFDSIMN